VHDALSHHFRPSAKALRAPRDGATWNGPKVGEAEACGPIDHWAGAEQVRQQNNPMSRGAVQRTVQQRARRAIRISAQLAQALGVQSHEDAQQDGEAQ
jgi:hypothetical protein